MDILKIRTTDVLVYDSSTGPTRKGRQKPDIGASGNFTLTTAVLEILEDLKINNPSKVATEGWHAAYAGTSAAAPVVAGTVACYFQLFPDAGWEEVKDKLISSAKVDSFVLLKGAAPNFGFGYGKLDGFRFINEAIVLGCTDSDAPNFDPMANVDDGSCTLVGVADLSSEVELLEAIPNPADQSTLIRYALKNERPTHVDLTDLQGKLIRRYPLDQISGEFRMETSDLPAGLYLYSLRQSERVSNAQIDCLLIYIYSEIKICNSLITNRSSGKHAGLPTRFWKIITTKRNSSWQASTIKG